MDSALQRKKEKGHPGQKRVALSSWRSNMLRERGYSGFAGFFTRGIGAVMGTPGLPSLTV